MIPNGWRIVFMGTSHFACPSLQSLIAGKDKVVGIITQPDKPQGRGRKLNISPVKALALQHHLPLFQPEKINASTSVEVLTGLSPDLIVVAAFGQILSPRILSLPRKCCINVHASLLPRYRGAAPINWAIIQGESKTGVTTMLMDRGLDTGDILLQREIPILPDETAGELHDRLAKEGAELLRETMGQLWAGDMTPRAQDHAAATFAPPLKKEDGLIDWHRPAKMLWNQVRGMNPWPGAYTFLEGKLLKVLQSKLDAQDARREPGIVLEVTDRCILVGSGEGCLLLTEIQLEGRKRMSAAQFLLGHPISVGIRLGNLESS